MSSWVSAFRWCVLWTTSRQSPQSSGGYSKRLRCLNRTHRIAIGSLHEIVGDERQRVEIRYIESKLQKGNIYTKALVPAQFNAERMQRPSNHSNN